MAVGPRGDLPGPGGGGAGDLPRPGSRGDLPGGGGDGGGGGGGGPLHLGVVGDGGVGPPPASDGRRSPVEEVGEGLVEKEGVHPLWGAHPLLLGGGGD